MACFFSELVTEGSVYNNSCYSLLGKV